VQRKYGLESTVAITLMDPASFFADDEDDSEAPPQPNVNFTVTVSSGPLEGAAGAAAAGSSGAVGGKVHSTNDAAGKAAGLAQWLVNRGQQPLPGVEFRQRLAVELQKISAQIATEYDRPDMCVGVRSRGAVGALNEWQ